MPPNNDNRCSGQDASSLKPSGAVKQLCKLWEVPSPAPLPNQQSREAESRPGRRRSVSTRNIPGSPGPTGTGISEISHGSQAHHDATTCETRAVAVVAGQQSPPSSPAASTPQSDPDRDSVEKQCSSHVQLTGNTPDGLMQSVEQQKPESLSEQQAKLDKERDHLRVERKGLEDERRELDEQEKEITIKKEELQTQSTFLDNREQEHIDQQRNHQQLLSENDRLQKKVKAAEGRVRKLQQKESELRKMMGNTYGSVMLIHMLRRVMNALDVQDPFGPPPDDAEMPEADETASMDVGRYRNIVSMLSQQPEDSAMRLGDHHLAMTTAKEDMQRLQREEKERQERELDNHMA
eukprot:scpid84972/ scgid1606/ 